MRGFAVLFLFAIVFEVNSRYVSDDTELSSEEEACASKLKLSKSWVAMLNNQETTTEDNEKYNDFLACYWQKKGYQDENGNVNFNAIKNFLREAFKEGADETNTTDEMGELLLNALLDGCKTLKGNNSGQTAVKIQNCISRNLIELQKLVIN